MIRIHYVGHACLLIGISGMRILTDPMLRPRVGHLRRVVDAPDPMLLEDVDMVLVSHAHHDHLDVPSLRTIPGSPMSICATSAAKPLRAAGLKPESLRPGEAIEHRGVSFEATAAEHDGRRWPLFSRDPEAIGFLIRGGDGSVYFPGDTGHFDGMAALAPVDVALLPVAGWGPRLGPGHLDPEGAAEAAAALRPRVAIPIHWGTYERMLMRPKAPRDDPARRFAAAVAAQAPEVRVEVLDPGDSLEVAPD